MMRDTMCALPWLSVSIDGPGRSRVCCNNHGHWDDEQAVFIHECSSAEDLINTDLHKSVRRSMLAGQRHHSCSRCWDVEDAGGRSHRQIWNEMLLEDLSMDSLPSMDGDGEIDRADLRYMDITWGNSCNLTCRMCNWSNSHLWLHDLTKLGRPERIPNPRIRSQDWFEHHHNLDLLQGNLGSVRRINFLGGEPLIIKQHVDLLQSCIDRGVAADISLSYNTNMTRMSEALIDIWRAFREVNLAVSIDAVGSANDYIRQNSSWADIIENLDLVHSTRQSHNIKMQLHSTFGIYNCFNVSELAIWSLHSAYFDGSLPWINMVRQPRHQDVRWLPNEAKQLVMSDLRQVMAGQEQNPTYHFWQAALSHLSGNPEPYVDRTGISCDGWQQFWKEADELDALKQRSMRQYLPRLEEFRP